MHSRSPSSEHCRYTMTDPYQLTTIIFECSQISIAHCNYGFTIFLLTSWYFPKKCMENALLLMKDAPIFFSVTDMLPRSFCAIHCLVIQTEPVFRMLYDWPIHNCVTSYHTHSVTQHVLYNLLHLLLFWGSIWYHACLIVFQSLDFIPFSPAEFTVSDPC